MYTMPVKGPLLMTAHEFKYERKCTQKIEREARTRKPKKKSRGREISRDGSENSPAREFCVLNEFFAVRSAALSLD